MDLSAGELIPQGGLICGQKKRASETTDIKRQNEHLYLKNEENASYYSFIYSLKKICTRNRTSLAQQSESTLSYGRAYVWGLI